MNIFVYGTLLPGMSRSSTLAQATRLGFGSIPGTLVDLGDFPGLVRDESPAGSMVYGEVYEIDAATLDLLDEIEGYTADHPAASLYLRSRVQVTMLHHGGIETAWTYVYNLDPGTTVITHGDYRRYIAEQQGAASDAPLWYLAYGSNMSSVRLRHRVGACQAITTTYLEGYRLVFNKQAQQGDGVYANLAPAGPDARCPCVAYALTADQWQKLDQHEGAPHHYQRIGVPFSAANGATRLGQIYLAHVDWLAPALRPLPAYLTHIHQGYLEHGFDTRDLPPLEAQP